MINAILCCLWMHPFHVSLCEAEWNSDSERFEFAMRLEPRDFQIALHKHSGKRIDLESTDPNAVRAAISAYVRTKFIVQDPQQRAADWHWVGIENQTKYVWVYMELQPKGDARQLLLSNTMLHEVAATQINTVLLRSPSGKQTLRFSRSQPTQTIAREETHWQVVNIENLP